MGLGQNLKSKSTMKKVSVYRQSRLRFAEYEYDAMPLLRCREDFVTSTNLLDLLILIEIHVNNSGFVALDIYY